MSGRSTFIDVDGHGVTIDRLSGTRIRFYEEECDHDYNMVKLILDGMNRKEPSTFPEPATDPWEEQG